jgi:DNA repair protein RadD
VNEEPEPHIFDLIIQAVRERDRMTRWEILEEFGLPEEDYAHLLSEVRRDPTITAVQGRTGGLRIGGIDSRYEEDEVSALSDEVLEHVLDTLQSERQMTRRELYEQAGIDSPDEYKAFTKRLASEALDRGLLIQRLRGAGGVELMEGPADLWRRLQETGQLNLAQLKELSGLRDVRDLCLEIEALAAEKGHQVRRLRGRGGIVLASAPASTAHAHPAAPASGAAPPLEPWQERAVAFLCELPLDTLEALVGKKMYQAVRSLTGSRSRRELAIALVLNHGEDLFAELAIREAVADHTGVEAPLRWFPGKRAAEEFVDALGLPPILAGEPAEEAKPHMEHLEGRIPLRSLEDYQRSVQTQLLAQLDRPSCRALVSLPTGAGKTRVAVETIRELLTREYDPATQSSQGERGAILWLAHTEELCEQACACVKEVWQDRDEACPVDLVRFWGSYSRFSRHGEDVAGRLDTPTILVSTPQRIDNLRLGASVDDREAAQRFLRRLRDVLRVVVVDEAHRAAAPIYRRILETLQVEPASLLGLTATPFRNVADPEAGARELKEVFGELVEPDRIDEVEHPTSKALRDVLERRRVLARAHFETIETGVRMGSIVAHEDEELSVQRIEALDQQLRRRADRPSRRERVFERLLPVARDPNNLILYFGPTISDAQIMTYKLQSHGIPAAVVSGQTREQTRRRVIDRFKQRTLRVLCNCEVLTTGFDHPPINHVFISRPTLSQVLYQQMVGRGLRGERFGGTAECVIHDCYDEFTGQRPKLGYERFRGVWEG